ncbi:UDP-N-acetylglucosamine 4,6-dehydratase (inverting) [Patescibacteria group bacterium]|nr:UDP-N-acetylglucosamine 4,6-dehydratase (inverting) [Patescibacteria group bacterium]
MSIENKTFLITGGCGSFGQKFAEVILKEYSPQSIRIYDNDELAAVEMERKFQDSRLRFFIGDVRDKTRLYRAMEGVDIVVHAAALKHVPICEYNPIEAVKTNIEGAVNVIDAVIDKGVERIIAISTDKAVHPVNLYGATKLVAEKLFVQGNSYAGGKNIKLSCARYGNVVGSSGSVVPLFLEQKRKGEITITDEEMTRFWITLEQGIRFVIRCLENMKGGEVYVPKIASMKITDLAEVIAPDAKRNIIGIRSGEKMHEVLITENEAAHTKEFDDYFVIEPEFPFWDEHRKLENGNLVPKGFRYASDTNTRWLTKEELRDMLAKA